MLKMKSGQTNEGGLEIYRNLDLDETGANVKATAGQVFGWYLYNAASATRHVKFYDKATAPTVGSDTPVLTITLPPTSGANVFFGLPGIQFDNGIGLGATTGVADNNAGAPSANDVIVNVLYV